MKQYYLDKRVLVNGKTSHIELSNFVNLNSFIISVAKTITDVVLTTGAATSTLSVKSTETLLKFDNGTTSSSVSASTNIGNTTAGIVLTGIPTYANEAAALAAGLVSGALYKTAAGDLLIKL